jgi:hypothetical protein
MHLLFEQAVKRAVKKSYTIFFMVWLTMVHRLTVFLNLVIIFSCLIIFLSLPAGLFNIVANQLSGCSRHCNIDICVQYLQSIILSQADVMDIFNGIQFLPLDKNTYLRVQCFINQLEASFPETVYSMLVYNDQLVW